MSTSALTQFYDHVRANPELEIRATRSLKDSPESLVLLAKLEGFDFSEEELLHALSHGTELEEGELCDTDLDLVAGGGSQECRKSLVGSPINRF